MKRSLGLSTKCEGNNRTPVNTGWYGRQAMIPDTLRLQWDAKGTQRPRRSVSPEHHQLKVTSTS